MKQSIRFARTPYRSAGFTLFEVMLTMLIVVMVLTGVLVMFDFSSEIARAQTHVANMQQSLRVVQYDMMRQVRMTARGPLPQTPTGVATADEHDVIAVAVRNNVPPSSNIAVGDTDSPEVVSGTDVLTIRGVFTNSLYQFNPTAGVYSVIGDPPASGTLIISDQTPTGIPQNLEPFREIIDREPFKPEALLVVSPLDDAIYGVVKINNGSSYTLESGAVTQVSLEFDISCGTYCNEFNAISAGGSYPATMTTAAFAGILEEYRYYIREAREIPGDDSSRLSPRLSKARFYPGTEIAHLEDSSNLQADVGDNILDLQVALGIDSAPTIDDVIVENDPPDADDDWLFNSTDDDSTDTAKWVGTAPDFADLFYVRINTLARTDRQDRGTEADLLGVVEDKDYSVAPGLEYNTGDQRAFRRRWMQTVIDMRNVS